MAFLGAIALLAILLIRTTESASILGIFPIASYSQWYQGHRLLTELASKGHQVTMLSPFQDAVPIKNYRPIVVEESKFENLGVPLHALNDSSVFVRSYLVSELCYVATENFLNNPHVQMLIKSNERFDLIVAQEFFTDAVRGFQHRFGAPVVGVNPIGATFWANEIMGNPSVPSFVPEVMTKYSSEMTFFERLVNQIVFVYARLLYHFRIIPKHDQLMHEHFPNAPHLTQLLYNTSLILLNSHISTNMPVPLLPNMIEVGGYHLAPEKELPADLKAFLDDANDGVVFFSLGSHFKSANLPVDIRRDVLDVFRGLKEKVLWKFEDDSIDDLPGNVMVRKWLPQQDVLAHPNVKLFITHGGLLSTIETTYYGKPIVGIPIFGDQEMNMMETVRLGYGQSVPYAQLTKDKLANAIKEVLSNPQYKKNMELRSKLMRDQPMKPMEKALYWVEYVLRHNGAPHYRSVGLKLARHQYYMLDVILFELLLVYLIIFTIRKFIRLLFNTRTNVTMKKKKN